MILISSSLGRPVRTSVSTPRRRKISTAAGESWSAMRTLGIGLTFVTLPLEGGWPRNGRVGGYSSDRVVAERPPPPTPPLMGEERLGRRKLGGEGGVGPVEPGRQGV